MRTVPMSSGLRNFFQHHISLKFYLKGIYVVRRSGEHRLGSANKISCIFFLLRCASEGNRPRHALYCWYNFMREMETRHMQSMRSTGA